MEPEQDAPVAVCSGCGEQIDPADPSLLSAREQVPLVAMGVGRQMVDGKHHLFHPECFRGGERYRLAV